MKKLLFVLLLTGCATAYPHKKFTQEQLETMQRECYKDCLDRSQGSIGLFVTNPKRAKTSCECRFSRDFMP